MKIQSEQIVVLSVASSGIVTLLLDGGRTAHSTFKIPFEIVAWSMCNVANGTSYAELLKKVDLFIWDEVVMQK